MKVKDIQTMYENGLLSENGKDCFIFLLKQHKLELEDEIPEIELKHWR